MVPRAIPVCASWNYGIMYPPHSPILIRPVVYAFGEACSTMAVGSRSPLHVSRKEEDLIGRFR